MSRQYDDYIDGKFEYNGRWHALVEPTNFDEFVEALRVCDMLQELIDCHMPDDADGFMDMQQEQRGYISQYIQELGDYSNATLNNNIAFLLKRSGMRLGQLESALGISTGYISRTANPRSGKKMSIDTVWKIAKLFGVDLQALITKDLNACDSNTDLACMFLEELITRTSDQVIEWDNCTEVPCLVMDHFKATGVLIEVDSRRMRYMPKDRFNPNEVLLTDDGVLAASGIREGWSLVMIRYWIDGKEDMIHYDFLFAKPDAESDDGVVIQKCFYSTDDPFRSVSATAERLYKMIDARLLDTRIDKNVKTWMKEFLKH